MTDDNTSAACSPNQNALGFQVELRGDVRVLAWHEGGCRPATVTEIALWDALAAAEAERDRLSVMYDQVLMGARADRKLLRELVDAAEAYAKAMLTLENAQENFTDDGPEMKAYERATTRLSAAEHAARAALSPPKGDTK